MSACMVISNCSIVLPAERPQPESMNSRRRITEFWNARIMKSNLIVILFSGIHEHKAEFTHPMKNQDPWWLPNLCNLFLPDRWLCSALRLQLAPLYSFWMPTRSWASTNVGNFDSAWFYNAVLLLSRMMNASRPGIGLYVFVGMS